MNILKSIVHVLNQIEEIMILAHQTGIPVVLPMWDISISQTHKPVRKIKKLTAASRPQASRTSIRDVILMLKLRHPVASQRS